MFVPSMGRQAPPVLYSTTLVTHSGSKFRLNPCAPPFVPGALTHPPTAVSPVESDLSSDSTVLPGTLVANWRPFAPRVPAMGPYGAGIFAHPGPAAPAMLAQAGRYLVGAASWNYPHPYGWAEPVFATAPPHLAYGGSVKYGFSGARKSKKKGRKGKGKRAAW